MNSHCDCKIGVNCWLLLYNHTVLMHITVSIHCTATGQKHSTQLIQHCHEKKRWKDQPFMSYHQPQYLRYEIAYNWVREQLVVFQLAKWIQRRSMSQQSLQCSQKNKGLVTCCHTQTHTHTAGWGRWDAVQFPNAVAWAHGLPLATALWLNSALRLPPRGPYYCFVSAQWVSVWWCCS